MSERFYIKVKGSDYDHQGVTDFGSIGFGVLKEIWERDRKYYGLSTNKWLYLSGESVLESDYNHNWIMVGNIVEFKTDLLNILYGVE